MDVNIFVYDDEHFGPCHLTCTPDCVHDAAGLEWIFFSDFDECAIVEAAEHGEIVVDDVVDECF